MTTLGKKNIKVLINWKFGGDEIAVSVGEQIVGSGSCERNEVRKIISSWAEENKISPSWMGRVGSYGGGWRYQVSVKIESLAALTGNLAEKIASQADKWEGFLKTGCESTTVFEKDPVYSKRDEADLVRLGLEVYDTGSNRHRGGTDLRIRQNGKRIEVRERRGGKPFLLVDGEALENPVLAMHFAYHLRVSEAGQRAGACRPDAAYIEHEAYDVPAREEEFKRLHPEFARREEEEAAAWVPVPEYTDTQEVFARLEGQGLGKMMSGGETVPEGAAIEVLLIEDGSKVYKFGGFFLCRLNPASRSIIPILKGIRVLGGKTLPEAKALLSAFEATAS